MLFHDKSPLIAKRVKVEAPLTMRFAVKTKTESLSSDSEET